jgi:hypothetical protein
VHGGSLYIGYGSDGELSGLVRQRYSLPLPVSPGWADDGGAAADPVAAAAAAAAAPTLAAPAAATLVILTPSMGKESGESAAGDWEFVCPGSPVPTATRRRSSSGNRIGNGRSSFDGRG